MSYDDFSAIDVTVRDSIAVLTINHPPINLFDLLLISEMDRAGQQLAADEDVRVVLIQSADKDFFIAHADVTLIQDVAASPAEEDPDSSFFHAMTERFRLMSKPTIAKVNGIARGGGLELLAALDMRFCSIERTRLAQPEVTVGIIPGGGGSSRWPALIGYARAMELMIGGFDFDGATAEKYGLVNRALPEQELDGFVERLVRQIASYPPHAVAMIKSVGQLNGTVEERLAVENRAFLETARHPTATSAMKDFLDAGGQTREVELTSPFGS
ncbi:MAG: enoyl-CoA hydratase/isomerase family protein [Pseudomonadota bacterium]